MRTLKGGGGAEPVVEQNGYPSFTKEGRTRRKEKCREASFEKERTGWLFQTTACPSRTTRIIGGLKQPPRLRCLRNGAIFFMRSHPSFAKAELSKLRFT